MADMVGEVMDQSWNSRFCWPQCVATLKLWIGDGLRFEEMKPDPDFTILLQNNIHKYNRRQSTFIASLKKRQSTFIASLANYLLYSNIEV